MGHHYHHYEYHHHYHNHCHHHHANHYHHQSHDNIVQRTTDHKRFCHHHSRRHLCGQRGQSQRSHCWRCRNRYHSFNCGICCRMPCTLFKDKYSRRNRNKKTAS